MTTCARCGHTVEVGRFCTNCGAPVDQGASGVGPTDTAERPAVQPDARPDARSAPAPSLPPVGPPPTPARFPLFADEVSGPPGPPPSDPPPVWEAGPEPAATPPGGGSHRRRTSALAWGFVIAAVLVVVALVGVVLVVGGLGDDDPTADDAPSASPTSEDEPTTSDRPRPSQDPDDRPEQVDPDDLATTAEIDVPSTAPPGTDVDGRRIRYDASQMTDGDPGTCWRMTGDGTGEEIVITLPEPTTVSAVGLINGYAKTATDGRREIDWYAGNRRILAVDWVLDDGTTVRQDLDETREPQAVDIDPVETSTITLRLVKVSKPGRGRAARDNTAISELVLVGQPAG